MPVLKPSEAFLPVYQAGSLEPAGWAVFVTPANSADVNAALALTARSGDLVVVGDNGVSVTFPTDFEHLARTFDSVAMEPEIAGVRIEAWYGFLYFDQQMRASEHEDVAALRANFAEWTSTVGARLDEFDLSARKELTILSFARDEADLRPEIVEAIRNTPSDVRFRAALNRLSTRPDVANLLAPFVRADRPIVENIALAVAAVPALATVGLGTSTAWRSAVGASSRSQTGTEALVRQIFAQVTLQAPETVLAVQLRDRPDVEIALNGLREQGESVVSEWADAARRNISKLLDESGARRAGYVANMDFASGGGMMFMSVVDNYSRAIYAWPAETSRPLADINERAALPVIPPARADADILRVEAAAWLIASNDLSEVAPREIVKRADEAIATGAYPPAVEADDEEIEFDDEDADPDDEAIDLVEGGGTRDAAGEAERLPDPAVIEPPPGEPFETPEPPRPPGF